MKLHFKKLVPEARIPERAHATDAGLDLFSAESVVLGPGERHPVRTGIATAVPAGYVGLIWDKSGRAVKEGLKTMGGVIDTDYRGDIQVIVTNLSQENIMIEQGQKVAQFLIQKVELPEPEEVTELEDTERGEGGLGSTGLV